MNQLFLSLILTGSLLLSNPAKAQEAYFLKNVLDTLFQVDPFSGNLGANPMPTDFPGQSFFGYMTTIDPIGRRYMYVTRLSATNYDVFGLKLIDLDSMSLTTLSLNGHQGISNLPGQFPFNGLEFGAIADQLYMASVEGDSLYQIDLSTGEVTAVQSVPNFASPYSYLHTFNQSEQRYAMIGLDPSGQRRFFQVDLDDDTTYVSPPMSFPEPLRGLEFSEATGEYYAVSDVDQTFYRIDPFTGQLTALFPIPAYQSAFGYLHTFDFAADQYLCVGLDTLQNDSLSLFSIFPASNTVYRVAFPYPQAGFFGLEATNTQFIAKMLEELNSPPTSLEPGATGPALQVFPNPVSNDMITVNWQGKQGGQLSLLDFSGRICATHRLSGGQVLELSTLGLARGIYSLRLHLPETAETWTTRIVVE